MKNFSFLLTFVLFSNVVFSQDTYDWVSNAPDGNFRQGAANCRWSKNSGASCYWDEPQFGVLKFANNTYTTMTNNATSFTTYRIEFNSGASSTRTIGGNSIGFYDYSNSIPAIFNNSGASHVINFAIEIGNTSSGTSPAYGFELNAYNGSLSVGGNISAPNSTGTKVLVLMSNFSGSGTSAIDVSGNIVDGSGTVAVLKKDNNTATLTGTNTYTGSTTVQGGTLRFNKSGGGTIPSTNDVTVTGGTLQISTDQTLNNVTISGGTLQVDAGKTLTINGTFTGGGTIINNGKIVLTGSSTFPGSSTTLSAMNDLEINRSGGVTLDKDVTIAGTLTLTSGKLNTGSNTLIIANGASISGASSSNYITGKLQINNVTTARTFPVGNTTYNPATIANAGTADNFTVSVGDFITSDGTSGGTAVTTKAVQRTWTITEGTAGGSDVTLTLQWNAGEELGTFSTERGNNNIYISHYTGGGWNAGSAGSASGAGPYTISRSGITSFSPFGIGGGGALPVTLIDFSATVNSQNMAELSWKTASEINASHFSVYRAGADGNKEMIGTLQAAGNSSIVKNYHFTDPQPIAAKTFYLLEQVDFDGKTEWFGPVSVEASLQNKITLFPLPATDVIFVNGSFSNDEPLQLTLTDISGKTVLQKDFAAGNPVSFEVSGLARGTYMVKTLQGNNLSVTKLIY